MPDTILDPTALIVVDRQAGPAGQPTACDLPDGFTDLLPALGEHSSDKTVTKHAWGAFHNTTSPARTRQRQAPAAEAGRPHTHRSSGMGTPLRQ